MASAEAFVESVGVNVHVSSEPYASRFGRFRELVGASGIRHLRDELRPDNDLKRWRDLHSSFGIRSHLLVSPATNTVPQLLDYLGALGLPRVSAIEGQNEGDSDWFKASAAAHGDWSGTVVAYQRDVFRALRERYAAAALPILSPSVIDWKPDDVRLIRPASAFCDIVALHSYVQHGQEPETNDDYAGLSWYERNMRDTFKPGAPVMVTETGYSNLVSPGGSGVSEAAAATYLPRLLLHNFAAGVQRTFLYEFMDGGLDAASGEDHWGLLHNDGTPKPAYHAIRALIEALDDRRTRPASDRRDAAGLDVALTNAPTGLRRVGFRKSDGSVVLALWRAMRSWDVERAQELVVPPLPLGIVTDSAVTQLSSMVLAEGAVWTSLPVRDGKAAVQLADKVLLLRLTGQNP